LIGYGHHFTFISIEEAKRVTSSDVIKHVILRS
jgi:hypothetical protein